MIRIPTRPDGPRRTGIPGGDPARTGGFTLVEIVVAMTLLSIVFAAAGGLLLSLSRSGAYGRTRTATAFHMQQQIERLYNTPFASLSNGTADTTLTSGAKLHAEWTVTSVVPGRLVQVDLTVDRVPSSPGGSDRAVRLFIENRNP